MRDSLFLKGLLVSLVLMVSASVSAYDFSAVSKSESGETTLYYSINADGKTATLTYGPDKYAATVIVIPETVEHEGKTYTVTAIGYQAFSECDVDSVLMANTITEVQASAFNHCTVARIGFSKNLRHIRDYAFNGTNLQNVILHEGVEFLGKYAFADYTVMGDGTIRSIVLPNTITSIGEHCFLQQRLLAQIVLPENLETIEENVFDACINLSEVVLPKNLKEIKRQAFVKCPLNEVVFPSTLKVIGEKAFSKTGLTTVVLPDNIEALGEGAFASNQKLTSITFSKGMTELPDDVCENCEQLVDVNIPEGIVKVGACAFAYCTRLSHVTFPESVTELGNGQYGQIFIESGISSFTFPSKLKYIVSSMFAKCYYLTEMDIPETIEKIEADAFSGCENLKKVVLPNGLKEILSDTFDGCKYLEGIVVPEGVEKIGDNAFRGCEALKTVVLPKTLKEVGQYAFQDCHAITELTFPHETSIYGQYVFRGLKNAVVHVQRAIVPKVTGLANNPTAVDANNNCILYVPIGAKASYEASAAWNVFSEIKEEAVPDVYYAVGGKVSAGKGKILVNGEELLYSENYQKEYILNSEATIEFVPSDNYMIESVLCNGEDVTGELDNGVYKISSLETNCTFSVSFKENPVVLHLKMGEGGSIDVLVEKGGKFACSLIPEDGWSVNCVYFNGRDVTAECLGGDGNSYLTPALTSESTLSVSFENTTGIDDVVDTGNRNLKVYSADKGILVVEGAQGEDVEVFTVEGVLVESVKNVSERLSLNLRENAVYVVKTDSKIVKVAL